MASAPQGTPASLADAPPAPASGTSLPLLQRSSATQTLVGYVKTCTQSWFAAGTTCQPALKRCSPIISEQQCLRYLGYHIDIAVTVTVAVLEREKARKCFYLLIFLGLYLLRSIVICGVLLRRFLYIRPDDLPRDISGACGAHYKTMINWASLILLLFSISLLTTQSHCAKESPGLFYLILAFSLLGYLCLAALLFLWIFVLFCFNGLMTVLELFGVGPRVMKWEGATQEMLDAIPIIKFSKPEEDTEVGAKTAQPGSGQDPSTSTVVGSSSPKNIASNIVTPSIVVVPDDPVEPHPASGSVVVDMEHSAGVLDRNKGASVNNTTGTEHDGGDASNTLPLENLNPEEQALDDQMSPSCAICLCDYEDLEELRHLPCDHIFHKDCVDEWLKLKRTCPLCKYDISHMRRGSRFWSRRGRRNGNTSSGSRGGSGSAGRFSIGSRR
ncbi:MAG: hypothetical protein J3Q66DRAFT_54912 [Benniella sp.]|nr:MAG: hypothetical protein J3Q66DRAFT_54912 [Benniella sp.]